METNLESRFAQLKVATQVRTVLLLASAAALAYVASFPVRGIEAPMVEAAPLVPAEIVTAVLMVLCLLTEGWIYLKVIQLSKKGTVKELLLATLVTPGRLERKALSCRALSLSASEVAGLSYQEKHELVDRTRSVKVQKKLMPGTIATKNSLE